MSVRLGSDWSFNGVQALVTDNGLLRVVVLPELGGKVWQVTNLRTGRDLLWHNPRIKARRVPFGAVYDDVFFGGWDELFPNDMPEELGGEPYPDHGELWASALDWRVEHDGPDLVRISMSMQTPVSACRFTKTLTLKDGDSHLRVSWRVENQGRQDLPYLWKQHVAVPVSEPARIAMAARSVHVEGFGSPRAGGGGTRYQWPYLVDDTGERHDMRRTLPGESGVSEFQYATELDDGWCSVTYADGSGIGLAFDREIFRSCWTFASYGGWRAHEVLILEPCTGYPVSVTDGIAAGTHQVLPARTSNDNPYSESQFKTMKYMPDYPDRFASIGEARAWMAAFAAWYNHEHRHSGIGLHTPANVHYGHAEKIQHERQQTLDAAFAAHPERFHRRPLAPKLPERVTINDPAKRGGESPSKN